LILHGPCPASYRIVAPDLPGFGESGRLDGQAYDYDAQVRHLLAFMDALGIAQAHLAGSSMGGTIAALLAASSTRAGCKSVAFIGSPHGIRSPRASADGPADRRRPCAPGGA
jgi:abhydrolase domain-containing protein 6